ncbi:hypothetical protein PTSG_10522 [Salpingoeca rosetta]|uniref:Uncharacterized protein n=1 Tax=Salpingoeca rosetta (strain ATCC 50818 / BSB-021) TaxID=946362 RepID=F2URL0_SALR5|nr:hypothetical protein PTSG_10522 [Salpingoeca rosetta]|eukprot:XP_004988055.1 hypothetical protein PTSG_10522 [Salpingoeca rosetta]
MSLSPLYPSSTTDLHVMIATSLHQNRSMVLRVLLFKVLRNTMPKTAPMPKTT